MRPLCLILPIVLIASFSLSAHPDHSATQKGVFPLEPSTQAATGASEIKISIEGEQRVITANGLPDHATGAFPNRNNPHKITAQQYRYTMPAKPVLAAKPTPLVRQPFGIALNGVLFDPGTAEAWKNDMNSGWRYEAKGDGFSLGLDTNNGHVQPNGAYHYHGIPNDLLKRLSNSKPQLTLLGWAADGFPIYGQWGYQNAKDPKSKVIALKSSYQLKKGKRPTTGDQPGGTYDGVFVEDFEFVAGHGNLDDCSGRFGPTPEFPAGTYHYVLTTDYPFIPRFFRGQPDASFAKRGGPGRPPGGRRGPRP